MEGDRPMHSYFHVGFKDYVLLEPLYTLSPGAMVGACFAIFALGLLYEGIKSLRQHLLSKSGHKDRSADVDGNFGNGFMPGMSTARGFRHISSQSLASGSSRQILSCAHLFQSLLYVVQTAISFCLMLVVMTFNVWLCLAVFLSAGVGYCVFGWKRAGTVDTGEQSH